MKNLAVAECARLSALFSTQGYALQCCAVQHTFSVSSDLGPA